MDVSEFKPSSDQLSVAKDSTYLLTTCLSDDIKVFGCRLTYEDVMDTSAYKIAEIAGLLESLDYGQRVIV